MELTYRYLAPSRLDAGGLTLATSGGFTPSGQVANPYFSLVLCATLTWLGPAC